MLPAYLSREMQEMTDKSLSMAWSIGYDEGLKDGKEFQKNSETSHSGLNSDTKIRDVHFRRNSLHAKLAASTETIRSICSKTKEQVAKKYNLTLRELLDMVDVLAQYNYSFMRTDFPF